MTDYTLRKIDPKLWHQVKILAAKKAVTIKALIINLLKQEVEKE